MCSRVAYVPASGSDMTNVASLFALGINSLYFLLAIPIGFGLLKDEARAKFTQFFKVRETLAAFKTETIEELDAPGEDSDPKVTDLENAESTNSNKSVDDDHVRYNSMKPGHMSKGSMELTSFGANTSKTKYSDHLKKTVDLDDIKEGH